MLSKFWQFFQSSFILDKLVDCIPNKKGFQIREPTGVETNSIFQQIIFYYMKDLEPDMNPVSDTDYRRAFQRVRMTNKKLSRQLAKVQNQIKERCQSYMMEITRLKQSRPEYRALPKRQLDIYPRLVDLKLGTMKLPYNICQSLVSPSNTSTEWRDKLDFSTAKITRTQSTDIWNTDKARRTEEYPMFETTRQWRIEEKEEEVEKLREELNTLRKQHKRERQSRSSERMSGSVSDSAAPEEAVNVEVLRREFDEEIRVAEEKIYVYEAIFVRIYNLLIKDRKDTMRTVEQIRSVKYNELQTKLQALFGLIRINEDTVHLLQREKQELMQQVQYLSGRVREFTQAKPICFDKQAQSDERQFVQKKVELGGQKIRVQSFELILPQCRTNKENMKQENNEQLQALKKAKICEITKLYELRITQKYGQISNLKNTMKGLIDELEKSVYTSERFLKTLKVDKEQVQIDSKLEVDDSFTKRHFVRKRIMRKCVSQTSLDQSFIDPIKTKNSLIIQVLKINKQLVGQRISEDQQEQRTSNCYKYDEIAASENGKLSLRTIKQNFSK